MEAISQIESDRIYIMNNALLECSILNDVDSDNLYLFNSKKNKNVWYILDRKEKKNGKPKAWFKYTFDNNSIDGVVE